MMAGINRTEKLSGSKHMFTNGITRGSIGMIVGLCAVLASSLVQAQPCVIPDNGGGTVDLPPLGGPECGYLSPDDVHLIIAGLPPGTTIRLGAAHSRFGNIIRTPGGSLGGEHEQFTSEIQLELQGTGDLNGYVRTVNMFNVQVQTDTAPRGSGTPQSFATAMMGMQGQLFPGDPDFDLLRITAGTGFGMPSPGHTTLTRQGPLGSPWAVDSFFDITYQIDFIGAPGGPLGGMSGSTTGTIRMQTGGGLNFCCMPTGLCQPLPQTQCNLQNGTPVSHCPLNGLCVPPSDDCFFTQCGQTNFDFCNDPIPAGFFDPGSDPFTGIVLFQGASPTSPDTLVHRSGAMLLDGPPETIPIELVQLNLVSCQPITVSSGLGLTQWNVAVDLSPTPAPGGTMTAGKTHPNGGVFSATFSVQPRFTFTEVGNPLNVRVLDTGGLMPPTVFSTIESENWVHNPTVPTPQCGVNFAPGIQEDPATGEQCCTETCHDNPGGGHKHCTKRCFVCPKGACCGPQNTCTIAAGAADCLGLYKGDGTNCNDTDGDGLADVFENNDCCQPSTACNSASSPTDPDTDNDGVLDGDELALGCDPCVPDCGNVCEPLPGGTGCTQTGCGCFGECIGGGYCDDAACCLDPNDCLCYAPFAMESIKLCGDCFGECIGSSYCDDVANPSCWVNQGGPACYAPNTVESIYLCKGCFGECVNGSYCDSPDPGCCIDPANCQCYAPGSPISLKMCPTVDRCEARCVNYNPFTGQNTVTDCDCVGWHGCHINLPGGTSGRGEVQRGTGNPCIVTDNGGGTVTLPPAGCAYLSPDDVHAIINGLPAGTTIVLGTIHKDFICHVPGTQNPVCSFQTLADCDEAGGSLGGEKECSDSNLELTMTGAGINRTLILPIAFETHTAPRTPGNPVQSFDTDMFRLFGQISNIGDPDFDLLRIVAGTDFGMPSPGHTTLTKLPGGPSWAVDSFFDITYRIDFIGAPGGPLAGMSGSTTGTIRMATGAGPSCVGQCPPGTECNETRVVNADGTVNICCNCVTPPPTCEALPDASGCTTTCPPPVGVEQCLPLTGGCNINQPGTCGVLSCDCQDPNVCHLVRDAAGYHCEGGCPVPPGGTCTLLGDGGFGNPFHCDCATPPVCEPNATGTDCNPVNCPVGPLGPETCQKKCVKIDAAGNIEVTDCACEPSTDCHVETHQGPVLRGADGGVAGLGNGCIVPDDAGTVDLPPVGCDYLSPDDVHMIVDGLPAGTVINLAPIHRDFICRQPGSINPVCSSSTLVDCEGAGGSLGGEMECADSNIQFDLSVVNPPCPGPLCGWTRPVLVPMAFETHTAPRTPGDPVQSFDTEMFKLQGQITGDPDFDLLRITAGSGFGMPSPGHTTLTRLPGGNWAVDSFFDITYRIDFVGAAGGRLDGRSGSTTGTIRMATTPPVKCVATNCPPNTTCQQTNVPQADGTNKICCDCVINDPTGACCTTGAAGNLCINTTQSQCQGTFLPGQVCSGIIVACCLPNGVCQDMDEVCCAAAGGSSIVGQTCTAPQACCFSSGSCQFIDPVCCQALGGIPAGPGTDCIDADGNGAADDCEPPTVCEPNTTGSGCTNPQCPPPTGEECSQRCANFNPLTGQTTITECDCRGTSSCHLVYPGGGASRDGGEDEGVVAGGPNGCIVPDNGGGTVTLPPAGCDYLSPSQVHMIIDGLPAGTTINLAPIHSQIFCRETNGVCSFPPGIDCEENGGTLGGQKECNTSTLQFQATCVGTCPDALAGFNRPITIPNVGFETHLAPRQPGQASQSFDTDMFRLFGLLPIGDPDFDLLRITAGSDFGLPSPGHTTLTRLGPPGSSWAVDSFFDITYRIDFVGKPGGALSGMSGSTTATIRMGTSPPFKCIGGCGPRRSCTPKVRTNADGTLNICCDCRPKRPVPDPTLLSKPRFVSLSVASAAVAGAAEENALRVRLVSLHHVVPPYTGGPSIPFTAFEGQVRYAGPPAVYVESSASGVRFVASQLQCSPYYRDWTAFNSCSLTPTICSTSADCPMGETCTLPVDTLLHVTGSAVTPSSVLEVEVLSSSCMGIEDTCEDVSDPLEMGTTRWGDVETPFNPPSTTAQPDVGDIAALVKKFQSGPGAPIKARVLLAGSDAFGTINIALDLDFSQIASCVDAFRGKAYPHTIQACP